MKKVVRTVILLSALTATPLIAFGKIEVAGIAMLTAFIGAALYIFVNRYKSMAYRVLLVAILIAAMNYPILYTVWGYITLFLVIPMIQLIMFGMDKQLIVKDLKQELTTSKGILKETAMPYGIMLFIGFLVIKLFDFPPEIMVGVLLIGACLGGASSNVMAFLGKENSALSISVTTITMDCPGRCRTYTIC